MIFYIILFLQIYSLETKTKQFWLNHESLLPPMKNMLIPFWNILHLMINLYFILQ